MEIQLPAHSTSSLRGWGLSPHGKTPPDQLEIPISLRMIQDFHGSITKTNKQKPQRFFFFKIKNKSRVVLWVWGFFQHEEMFCATVAGLAGHRGGHEGPARPLPRPWWQPGKCPSWQPSQAAFIADVNQGSSAGFQELRRFMPAADPASLFSNLGQIEICCFSIIYSG